MPDTVIKIENLSKRYIIGHETGVPYVTLRDVLAEAAQQINPFNRSDKSKSYTKEEFWALKDINLEIKQGEKIGIIGRNGAGKSTLLKILSRITEPTTGKVKIRGRVASLLEVGTGFHPELTGRENIFLNGAILGMRKEEIKRKFDEIVDFSGVEKFLDTPVKRYSSGMYVRLAFAVAAHLEPEILLIDEVLAVGDAEFQKKCLGKMDEVAKQGRTIVFVSHNMGAIRQLCDYCVIINQGMSSLKKNVECSIDEYLKNNINIPSIEIIDRKDRQGTAKLIISKAEVVNSEGGSTITCGSETFVVLHYVRNADSVRNVRIDIGIDNEMKMRIGHLSTNTINTDVTNVINKHQIGKITFKIHNIPLQQGLYYNTICVYTDNNVESDWVKDAFTFKIDFGDFYKTFKLPPLKQGNLLLNYEIVG